MKNKLFLLLVAFFLFFRVQSGQTDCYDLYDWRFDNVE